MNVAQSSSKHFSGFLVLRSTRPSISLVLRFEKKVLLEKFFYWFLNISRYPAGTVFKTQTVVECSSRSCISQSLDQTVSSIQEPKPRSAAAQIKTQE